jgi:1-acyl-sn-glycerol-3-phosphate acyltransferase
MWVYLHYVRFCERWILNLNYRVIGREKIPEGPFILAAKHQSAWETLKLHFLVEDPAIILKKELTKIPIYGRFFIALNMIPIDRSAGRHAIPKMIEHADKAAENNRPIVIFPQGTRVPADPDNTRPYKYGVAKLYEGLDIPVLPMALNSGVFWPRNSYLKRPGTVTVEFCDPILPGKDPAAMFDELRKVLEKKSEVLYREAMGQEVGQENHDG